MAWKSFVLEAGGWVSYQDTAIPGTVIVRFSEGASGRLELVELHMGGGRQPLTGEVLRRLNPSRLEAAANAPDVAAELRARIASAPGSAIQPGRSLREFIKPAYSTRIGSVPPSLVLNVSHDRKRPDEFYEQVASAFAFLSRESDRPAQDLAQANGVPVSTAHRWIKEARRRGILPPARRTQEA